MYTEKWKLLSIFTWKIQNVMTFCGVLIQNDYMQTGNKTTVQPLSICRHLLCSLECMPANGYNVVLNANAPGKTTISYIFMITKSPITINVLSVVHFVYFFVDFWYLINYFHLQSQSQWFITMFKKNSFETEVSSHLGSKVIQNYKTHKSFSTIHKFIENFDFGYRFLFKFSITLSQIGGKVTCSKSQVKRSFKHW